MSGDRTFVDTNIFVYAYDTSGPRDPEVHGVSFSLGPGSRSRSAWFTRSGPWRGYPFFLGTY
jgi:hypothetical protein